MLKADREQAQAQRDDATPSWLSDHRATVPDRVDGYLDRPALTERCMPTKQPLTVLKAPGGFGKTTVLAACCQTLAEQGVLTAWLSASEEDTASALDAHLAFAFQRAGLDVLESLRSSDASIPPLFDRMTVLLRALEVHGGPCVLALDELERVTDRDAMALLNRLIGSGVPGLHVAIACRELPLGLDIAKPVFQGGAEIVTAEDLRFSRAEMSRYFDWKLSRRELAAVAADCAGWPIALSIHRNATSRLGRERVRVVQDVVDNWVEARLWYDLSADDREFMLDVGLFDWFDAELLDEALSGASPMQHLMGLSSVMGLLEPVRGSAGKQWQLHPLIREHCTERRRRETPERYRTIHRRIALALAGRGETVAAMRHASEAADAGLVGEIFTNAGGIRIWLWEGADRLLAADRFVTDETISVYPRLALARVVAHAVRGRVPQARRAYVAAVRELAAVESAVDTELDVDRYLARGILVHNGCESFASDWFREITEEAERIAKLPGVGPVVRGAAEYGLCLIHNLKGNFEAALKRGSRAKKHLGGRSRYLTMCLDFQYGQIAMARGSVPEAAEWYRSGLAAAKRHFLHDPRLMVIGDVLTRELDLERNRVVGTVDAARFPGELWRGSVQFASYAAACAVASELALRARGVDAALSIVDDVAESAQSLELAALVRYLAGLRVTMLAAVGRVGEAQRAWRTAALPQSDAACLDLGAQSWREMEVLACARLRLCIACGDHDTGRRLVRDLVGVSAERGLRRTWMRALALAMALEESAGGDRGSAMKHLSAFLGLFQATDYASALVRERDAAMPVLAEFLNANPDSPLRASAEALMAASTAGELITVPSLSARESEVLALLETQTDKQIGEALGLTWDGVRYHVDHLFRKLKVTNRFEAVRCARALGLLPPE